MIDAQIEKGRASGSVSACSTRRRGGPVGPPQARGAFDANFAIHGAVVTQLLDSLGVAYSRVGNGATATVPDIARRANGFTVKILCHA